MSVKRGEALSNRRELVDPAELRECAAILEPGARRISSFRLPTSLRHRVGHTAAPDSKVELQWFRQASSQMRDALRLYGRYMAASIRSQLQYPGDFLLMTAGHLFTIASEFFAIWALFARFGSLRGWTLPVVALFYGITNAAFAFAEGMGRGFDVFAYEVKSGDFDRILLRPRSTALQVAGLEIQLMRLGRLIPAVAVILWSLSQFPSAHRPVLLLELSACIAGGACIFLGLLVLQATLSFWTIETLEIMNILTYGGIETASYPLAIYRHWFRLFFTFVVPLACINYLPVRALLGSGTAPPSGSPLLLAAPAAGFVFLLVSLRVWEFGVRHYRSTGS